MKTTIYFITYTLTHPPTHIQIRIFKLPFWLFYFKVQYPRIQSVRSPMNVPCRIYDPFEVGDCKLLFLRLCLKMLIFDLISWKYFLLNKPLSTTLFLLIHTPHTQNHQVVHNHEGELLVSVRTPHNTTYDVPFPPHPNVKGVFKAEILFREEGVHHCMVLFNQVPIQHKYAKIIVR